MTLKNEKKRTVYVKDLIDRVHKNITDVIKNYYNNDVELFRILRKINKMKETKKDFDIVDLYLILLKLKKEKLLDTKNRTNVNEVSLIQFPVLIQAWQNKLTKLECYDKVKEVDQTRATISQVEMIIKCLFKRANKYRDRHGRLIRDKATQSFLELISFMKISKTGRRRLLIELDEVPDQVIKDVAENSRDFNSLIKELESMNLTKETKYVKDLKEEKKEQKEKEIEDRLKQIEIDDDLTIKENDIEIKTSPIDDDLNTSNTNPKDKKNSPRNKRIEEDINLIDDFLLDEENENKNTQINQDVQETKKDTENKINKIKNENQEEQEEQDYSDDKDTTNEKADIIEKEQKKPLKERIKEVF